MKRSEAIPGALGLLLILSAGCGPDWDPPVGPASPDGCDGIDNDDDGLVDEDHDRDGDGFSTCIPPGHPATRTWFDCNDHDARIHPGAAELCDGVDTDCDGYVGMLEWDVDGDGAALCAGDCDDRDPQASLVDIDQDGFSVCAGDCDDTNADRWPGAPEGCDGVDTDCDGVVPADEQDRDNDGVSTCAGDCDDLDPRRGPGDLDLDGVSACDEPADCDDLDGGRFPGALDVCNNGIDEDCSGQDAECAFDTGTADTGTVDSGTVDSGGAHAP